MDGLGADEADEDFDGVPFFAGPNPFVGSKVRQSGALGNDLYVKSSFIFGGLVELGMGGGKKRKVGDVDEDDFDEEETERETKKEKKKKENRGLV